jgi:hypothetical protein
LEEMLGFFGSKFLALERENDYSGFQDVFLMTEQEKEIFSMSLDYYHGGKGRGDFLDFSIYQQGSGLGDLLYDNYISGKKSKKDILDLFCNPLKNSGESADVFFRLRTELGWPLNSPEE